MSRHTAVRAVKAVGVACASAVFFAACSPGASPEPPPASTASSGPSASDPSDTQLHFTASGDFSSSPEAKTVLLAIGILKPDLHLALGDLSYGKPGEEQDWCEMVTSKVGEGFPFELISGNHESNGGNGNINDFSACLPNQLPGAVGYYGRQYFVDLPAAHPLVRFVIISPGLTFPEGDASYAAGSPNYQWTASAIDDALSDGIPWVVVAMHKPCLSMGKYSCDPGTALISMLLEKRVDLVLSGHEHLYQRTKQLATGEGCESIVADAFNVSCVVDSDATMVKGAGTVFVTAGTGGMPLRNLNMGDAEAPYFAAWEALNANPTWGSLEVTLTATQLNATFARATGGSFADNFSLRAPG